MNSVCGDLTDQQESELHTVLVSKIEKKRTVKADDSLREEQKKAKRKEIKKETKPLIKGIMTDEQWDKWRAHRKTKKAERKANKG